MESKPDIVLISPPSAAFADKKYNALHNCLPPIGLGYLATMVRDKYSVEILDLGMRGMKGKDLKEYLAQVKPKLVGITSTVNNYRNGIRVAQITKEVDSAIIVIMGGPQPTFLPTETLQTGFVDIVCRHEGELTFAEITEHYLGRSVQRLDQIRGISFLKDGEIVHTEQREFITDLDQLAFPAYDLLNLEQYDQVNGVMNIVTGRGCPFNCRFCSANVYSGKRYRQRSLVKVLDEIELLHKNFNRDQFFIADDTFTYSKKRVKEFCYGLKERGLDIVWQCEGRVNTVDSEILSLMKESGCYSIQFGVESGSDAMLEKIDKGISTSEVKNAVRQAYEVGLNVICSMIIGLPDDNQEDILHTLNLGRALKSIQIDERDNHIRLVFAIFTPLPGTYFYQHAEDLGIRFLTRDWDQYNFTNPVISTRYLNSDVIQNLFYDAQMIAKL